MIDINLAVTESVDHPGLFDCCHPFVRVIETGMDMTMDKVSWGISFDNLMKAFEPPVAAIFSIMNPSGWRMGKNDINIFLPKQPPPQFADHPPHL